MRRVQQSPRAKSSVRSPLCEGLSSQGQPGSARHVAMSCAYGPVAAERTSLQTALNGMLLDWAPHPQPGEAPATSLVEEPERVAFPALAEWAW